MQHIKHAVLPICDVHVIDPAAVSVGHVHPDSTTHVLVHPSPLTKLPSRQPPAPGRVSMHSVLHVDGVVAPVPNVHIYPGITRQFWQP